MPHEVDLQTRFRAKIFNALSDPIRLEIMKFLQNGEKCVCEITPHLNLVQPLVSRHLKILKNAGLIKRRKESTWNYYSLTDIRILELINKLTPELLETIKHEIIEQLA
ncbi:MAG: ArsR/SmtB family transcription factor [Candidatus Thorarchaeota archaeon]